MDATNLQIFMFTRLSGVLDGITSYNTSIIEFSNGSKIFMDPKNEIVTIENHNSLFAKDATLTFRECTLAKLKELGFTERGRETRHSSSYDNIPIHFEH